MSNNREIVREFANLSTIGVHCKSCSTCITEFRYVKPVDGSRNLWRVKEYYMKWDVTFHLDDDDDCIYCNCGEHLGFKYDNFEWVLIKKNTQILY